MAKQSFVTLGISKVWQGGSGDGRVSDALINGSDIFPGMLVTKFGEAAGTNDVDLADTADTHFYGIVEEAVINHSYGNPLTLDEAVPDNTHARVCKLAAVGGGRNKVKAFYVAGGLTTKEGTPLKLSATDGMFDIGIVATDYIVAYAAQDITTDATDDQIVDVWI